MSERYKDDHELEKLLNRMPKLTDQRSKEEVYNRVKMEVDSQLKREKRKLVGVAFSKWMPFAVSIVSILLLTFLVSSYINDETTMKEESKSVDEESRRSAETEESAITSDSADSSEMTMATTIDQPVLGLLPLDKTISVYEDSLNEGTVFHFSLLENALSIPITIIIPKEQVNLDFPDMTPNSLQLYERYASQIDEESLGFTEYHPYKGYFVAGGNVLEHHLPADHGYDKASGTSEPYFGSINEIFRDFSSLTILNENSSPIEWDQIGVLNKPNKLDGHLGYHNYYNYIANNGETYLTPNFRAKYDTPSEAFVAMNTVENDIYTSVIPKDVTYSYKEENGIGIVAFDQPLNLEEMASSGAQRLIEAFALTAASFGLEVKLENVVQKQWIEFDLTKALPVPIGPNGFNMEIK